MSYTTYSYIDLQSIKEDTFGDTSILREIMELFIEGIDEFVNTLNDEFPNENWRILFQETHKIKPNITMFGIYALVDPVLELEACFRNEEHLEKADALIAIIISSLKQAKEELLVELKSMTNE